MYQKRKLMVCFVFRLLIQDQKVLKYIISSPYAINSGDLQPGQYIVIRHASGLIINRQPNPPRCIGTAELIDKSIHEIW